MDVGLYAKPHLAVDEQIELLVERTVSGGPPDECAAALRDVGYCRLSGTSVFGTEPEPVATAH